MEALQTLPLGPDGEKYKPDVLEYAWRIDAIGTYWREKNDKGQDLPSLINFDKSQIAVENKGSSEEEIEFPD